MSKIRRVGYILTALLAFTALTAFIWKPAPPAKFNGLSGSQLPMRIDSYIGVDVPVDAQTKAAIPSADIIQREYTGVDGSQIEVTVIGGTGRNQLHDPRSCLVGAGWQIENDHVEDLPGSGGIPIRSCRITDAEPENGDSTPIDQSNAEDLAYLYVVNRKPVASAGTIRWTLLKSDLLGQTTQPVYFIRTIETLPASDDLNATATEHQRLMQFTGALWKVLSPTIDQGESA